MLLRDNQSAKKQPVQLPDVDDTVPSPLATVFHNPVTISLVLVSNCMAAIQEKTINIFLFLSFLLRVVVDVVVVVDVCDLKTDASAILRPMIAPKRRERHSHASNSFKQA